MSKFQTGDKVSYDDMECVVAGYDDILDEHIITTPDGEEITISESLLVPFEEGSAHPSHPKGEISKPIDAAAANAGPAAFLRKASKQHAGHKSGTGETSAHNNVADGSTAPVDDHHQRTAAKAKKFGDALTTGSKAKQAGVKKRILDKRATRASDKAAAEAKHASDEAADDAKRAKAASDANKRLKFKVRFGANKETEDELTENQGSEDLAKQDEQLVEDQKLLDETAAGDTIKAKGSAASGVMSSSMTKNVIQAVAGMSKGDQVDFYNQMMSQYGKGKDWGVGDKAGSNKSSIKAKSSHAKSFKVDSTGQLPSVQIAKEDLSEILNDEDGLSEELQEKLTTLFEAAVNLRVHEEVSVIKEEIEADVEQEIIDAVEIVTEQVDTYLTHVAEEWVQENAVEIQNSLQMQLSDSFIEGLKELFSEHYMNVPEEKVDIVSALAERVEELEGDLNEQLVANVELVETLEEYNAEEIFDEMSEGLAMTQVDKFRALSEGLEYEGDEEDYRNKLAVIREQYFSVKPQQSTLNEEVELDEENNEYETVDPMEQDDKILQYAAAITRTLKR